MGRKQNKENGFKPCWEYYHCSEDSMKKCPAFSTGFQSKHFNDCWFYVHDNMKGGPEQHGPCAECEWNHIHGFFKDE